MTNQIEYAKQIISMLNMQNPYDNLIFIGDFNTFFDKDGLDQLNVFTSNNWIVVDTDFTKCTFKSLPRYAFNGISRLDHAIIKGNITGKLYIRDIDINISDHSCISCDIDFY